MSKILALDLGSSTGVARGEPGTLPADLELSTWEMPRGGGENVGPFAASFMTQFKAALVDVSLVIFEAPIMVIPQTEPTENNPFPKQRQQFRPDVVRRFYGMAFLIEGVCALRQIPCFEANIGSLKKGFAGHGKADKDAMILAAHQRGFKPKNEHEADAAACWWHVIALRFPKFLELYDPDFRTFMRGAKQ